MGTRNLTMVIQNGKTKVSQYGQWDGYPTGAGSVILKFFQRNDFDLSTLKSKISDLSEYTEEELDKIDKMSNWEEKHPHLSRNVGSDILNLIYDGFVEKIHLNDKFIYDSLFCEWAYLVDLDNNFLEIYKGFNKDRLDRFERFYDDFPNEGGYYACKLYAIFPLNDLPLSFLGNEQYTSRDNSILQMESTLKSVSRESKISTIMKNEE